MRWVELPDWAPPGPGRQASLFVEQKLVLVFHVDGRLHAIEDGCPHGGASFFGVPCEGGHLRCPAHGMRFDLQTGSAQGSPEFRLRTLGLAQQQGVWHLGWPGPKSDATGSA